MSEEIKKQEVNNVTVEAVEEEEATYISTETFLDEKLIHLLAVISARRDTKSRKWVPLYWVVAVFMLVCAVWWSYAYLILKDKTRGPVIIALMVIMAVILIRYLRTPPVQVAARRMKAYLGQRWAYGFDDEGIHMENNGQEGCFKWEEVAGWWEEEGYLIFEISRQVLAVKEDTLEPEELEGLKDLCWVYLGDAKTENI